MAHYPATLCARHDTCSWQVSPSIGPLRLTFSSIVCWAWPGSLGLVGRVWRGKSRCPGPSTYSDDRIPDLRATKPHASLHGTSPCSDRLCGSSCKPLSGRSPRSEERTLASSQVKSGRLCVANLNESTECRVLYVAPDLLQSINVSQI